MYTGVWQGKWMRRGALHSAAMKRLTGLSGYMVSREVAPSKARLSAVFAPSDACSHGPL